MTKKTLAALLASSLVTPIMADEKTELLKLRQDIAKEREELLDLKNTTANLIEVFVQQGLLDKQKAQTLMKAAKAKVATESRQELATTAADGQTATEPDTATQPKSPKSIRFAYVPEFVKEEIRQEVIAGLTNKVVTEVKADARKEQWGIPAALPEWVNNIKISGDVRLRAQDDFFGPANTQNAYLDYLNINQDGGHLAAHNKNQEYLNTTNDRLRLRERFRLAIDAKVTDGLKAGFRLSTTNEFSPVSSNQTLGNTGKTFEVTIDRAFIQYDFVDSRHNDWFTLWGGRIANPWLSTEMLYSSDLSFEGFAGTFRWHSNQDNPVVKNYQAANPNSRFGLQMGPQTPDSLFITLGAFPIQEVNFSTTDKWLFGGQIGADWLIHNDSRLKAAAAFYDYENTRARANARDSFTYDWTAPQYLQKGNTLVPINVNDGFNSRCTDSQSLQGQPCLFGLASDFKIFNATVMYDFAGFAPTHALVSLDYAKNLGYDAGRIEREFPGFLKGNNKSRTDAFQIRLDVGKQEIKYFKDWSAILAYRYIQRDAVLDAFTDTIFHQGGTDAKGWMIGGNYGLAKNTWLMFRWFSTEAIDGPPLDINTLSMDLNMRL
ncbi:MAG: putative porin [Methylovulum sp.]|uniref:putative porin n=1 Tax=Methylovulum sp. TaxID=1916980 RepID=UPI002633536D|nr:putative porin [Methylovulum sp.]MDD2722631.1 putative porin [Methylovulum sp.]MDD5123897.1 putative porin [Methylovulum sp.]